ncbi:unnamed protein product [Ectocarpus sp. 12 AP-2014]
MSSKGYGYRNTEETPISLAARALLPQTAEAFRGRAACSRSFPECDSAIHEDSYTNGQLHAAMEMIALLGDRAADPLCVLHVASSLGISRQRRVHFDQQTTCATAGRRGHAGRWWF